MDRKEFTWTLITIVIVLALIFAVNILSDVYGETINTHNLIVASHVYDTGGLDYLDVSVQCEGGEWIDLERFDLYGVLEGHVKMPFSVVEDGNVRARLEVCDLGKNCVSAESEWYIVDTTLPTCYIIIEGDSYDSP